MANPIETVDGVPVVCPSDYQFELEDVSSSEAGRTEDVTMQKMRIGQVRALSLTWNAVSVSDAATILTAFNPEYITVKYLDAMAGGYVTSEFYVGNRAAPMYNTNLGVWENITFRIVERKGT